MELLLIILIFQTYQTLSFPKIPSQTALVDSDAIIPYTFSDHPPTDPEFLSVRWYCQGKEVLSFDGKETISNPRFSLDSGATTRGQASLSIRNISIEDEGIYKCFITYLFQNRETEIQLYVQARPYLTVTKATVIKNEESLLRCLATGFYPKGIEFTWSKAGQDIHDYNLHKPQQMPNGTYSVISEVSVVPTEEFKHQSFSCQVNHVSLENPIQKMFHINFGVAPLIEIDYQNFSLGEEQILTCRVRGFYPERIIVKWFLNGTHEEKDSIRRLDQFVLVSSCKFKPTCQHQQMIISCQVEHDTLPAPTQKNLTIHLEECVPYRIHWWIFTAFILPIVIISYIWHRHKLKQASQVKFKVNHITAEKKLQHRSANTLHCTASYGMKKLTVQWFEEKSGVRREVKEIQIYREERPYTVEESRRLLHISSLTFNADIKYHKDVKLICRASCDDETREETYTCTEIVAKPNALDFRPQISESGYVQITLVFECFYPKEISINWKNTAEMSPQREKHTSNEPAQTNEDGTYTLESRYKFPGDYLKTPSCGVTVTWRHLSLDTEYKKYLKSTDLPWRPQIGQICKPPILINVEVHLECVISNYFPDKLTVCWYKNRGVSREKLPENPGGRYQVKHSRRDEQEDKTFKCCTSVTFTPTLADDQGAEFICRVQHPLLEGPSETSTGNLEVLVREHDDGEDPCQKA
uniref:Ig-like domain-containing protein n=1 Tax=Leptobrachium leishanense TaxID=445787 RepID=A0A8C5WL83_9ANUR